jgi:hypothetical protein
MDLNLYVKEGSQLKLVKVPTYVVKDLLRDRLSKSEIGRIHRFCDPVEEPSFFSPGSVVVDFDSRSAEFFQTGIDVNDLEPTWEVQVKKMTINNY